MVQYVQLSKTGAQENNIYNWCTNNESIKMVNEELNPKNMV